MTDDLRSLLRMATRISHPDGFSAGIQALQEHQETVTSLVRLDVEDLRPFLDHASTVVRQATAFELGQRGDQVAIPWLTSALETAPANEAEQLRVALAALGSDAMMPGLLEQLQSDSTKHRSQAIEGLLALGDPSAATDLAELLTREDSKEVAKEAFFATLELGGEQTLLEALPRFSETSLEAYRSLLPKGREGLLEPVERFVRLGRALDDPVANPVVSWLDWQWQLAILAKQEPEALHSEPEKRVDRTEALPWIFNLSEPVAWPLPDGGELVAQGQVAATLRLDYERRATSPEGDDVLRFEIRLVDAAGGSWQIDLLETAGRFLRADEPSSGSLWYLRSPEAWREAFRHQRLLSGAQTLEESREHVTLVVGEDRLPVFYKYQGALYDFAVLPGDATDPSRLLVRIHGLREAEEWEEIPPFVTPFDLADLLPTRHTVELWDEEDGELALDSPRVRRLNDLDGDVSDGGEPQAGVTIRA